MTIYNEQLHRDFRFKEITCTKEKLTINPKIKLPRRKTPEVNERGHRVIRKGEYPT